MTQPGFPSLARPALVGLLALGPSGAHAQAPDTSCFSTGGGTLQICRGGEAEGVFFAPRACERAANVQVVRMPGAAGPLQVVYQGEAPAEAGRRGRGEACAARRATSPLDGGAVRSGRLPEQLATTMPVGAPRLWEMTRMAAREAPRRRGRRARDDAPAPTAEPVGEGLGARNPMVVAGRDWGGDPYTYVFFLATTPTDTGTRHALLQARTDDFERFDLRGRDGEAVLWTPFLPGESGRRRGRRGAGESAGPAMVRDETGAPVIGNCSGQGFDRNDLVGSISVVDQTYHYFYTDALPADCALEPAKRRLGLYLRTSRDLTADRVWSTPRLVAEPLPARTLARVAKAKGLDRWVVSYSCNRPANTTDGPVADLCVQYTADLSLGSLAGLTWFSEPVAVMRSPAYLGLRSGGDGTGRFGRAQHFWMTDRYGNLETPASTPGKAGFLTWLDRLAPGREGTGASSVYGRPVYWGTWSVRAVEAR